MYEVWGYYYCYQKKFRCQRRWSENTSQNFFKIMLIFQSFFLFLQNGMCFAFNFMHELWPRGFIWHQYIRVTHCQSSAMSFIFTQYSFRNFLKNLAHTNQNKPSKLYWAKIGCIFPKEQSQCPWISFTIPTELKSSYPFQNMS